MGTGLKFHPKEKKWIATLSRRHLRVEPCNWFTIAGSAAVLQLTAWFIKLLHAVLQLTWLIYIEVLSAVLQLTAWFIKLLHAVLQLTRLKYIEVLSAVLQLTAWLTELVVVVIARCWPEAFMQHAFTIFREREKTRQDGGEAEVPLSVPPQLPTTTTTSPLPICNRSRGGGRKVGRNNLRKFSQTLILLQM